MEYAVETYREEEIIETSQDEAERMALSVELGLKIKDKDQDSRSRFRFLNEEECFVFQVLFPKDFGVSDYQGFIPTRVLREIRDYKTAYPTHTVKIMCPKPGEIDPVVIGGAHMYSWESAYRGDNYIIARFGAALEDFATLRKRALDRISERLSNIPSIPMHTLSEIAASLAKVGA